MDVVQSYLTTIIKGRFDLYEIRIFLKIVELANHLVKGKRLSKLLGSAFCADNRNCNLTIPIREVLTPNSHHYEEIKEALESMKHKDVKFYDPVKKVYYSATLLNNIEWVEGNGMITFTVPEWVIEYILNFITRNYTKYDLEQALSLPSPHAVRLFWLSKSLTGPVKFPINFLKEMLGVESKYKLTNDFIKRCIDPPMKLLAEKNLDGFRYKKVVRKNKCVALLLSPVIRQEKTVHQETAKATLSAWCSPVLRQILVRKCGMKSSELEAHKALLFEFGHLEQWPVIMDRIVRYQSRSRKGKGYVFQSMFNALPPIKQKELGHT